MITSVTIWSYEEMQRAVERAALPSEAVVISIIDPEETALFEQDTDSILTFRFHDVEPEWFATWTPEQRAQYRCMTAEEAKRCYEFIVRHHEKPEECPLYVNCMAGVSRSGAVGTFAHRFAQTNPLAFAMTNPDIHPNGHVLRLLMREWYGRDWPELEG